MLARLLRPGSALLLGLVLAPVAASAQAAGQEEVFTYRRPSDQLAFDVQLFEPSPSPRAITTLDLATIPSHLALTVGLWSSLASRPLVMDIENRDGSVTQRALVGHLHQTEVHASLGLFEYFELGLALPVVYTGHVGLNRNRLDVGAPPASDAHDVGLGNLRAFAKIPLARGAWPVALRVGFSLPTGGHGAFAGNLSWTFTPSVVVSHAFGRLDAAANVGLRLRERNGIEDFVLDDELVWGLGGRYNITDRFGLNAELIGRLGVSAGGLQGNRTPIEVLGGAVLQATEGLALQLGAGRGLTSGYGAPDWRVFAGARLTATRSHCAFGPEDYDGFEDGDYCADPDNDGDGLRDAEDRCPNDAEDRDGFLDEDGCPEPDNDGDGVLDDADRCPLEPEDRDNFEDADGCPDLDNDRDGIPDIREECDMEPEDLDNYQDDDGCPEPGPEALVVTRTETHLLLSQRIFFDYDSDHIRSVSLPILDEVANTLRRNPDITRVRIEGYTDGAGDADYNLDLSYRRARAVVEYLVSRHVPREALEYQGYGEAHPVADDSTPEGQALNRRVEFTIVAQAGAPPSSGQREGGEGGNEQAPRPRRRRGRGAAAP